MLETVGKIVVPLVIAAVGWFFTNMQREIQDVRLVTELEHHPIGVNRNRDSPGV